MKKSAKLTSRWRYYLVTTGIVGLVAIGAFFLFRKDDQPDYLTAPVKRGNLESTVLASGTMEAENMVSVGAQVSGQIKSLAVALGETVKAGQLIAEIDSLPQQNSLRNKEAALALVQAKKKAKEATLKQADLAFERAKLLLKSAAGSRADYETAEAGLDLTRAEIAALEAEIRQAEVALDTSLLELSYTKISSPIDGVVVAIVSDEGQTVNANQAAPTIVKVAQLERMTIKVEISEADVVRVRPGQRVYFTILGEPDKRYDGLLRAIEPAPESVNSDSTTGSSSTASSTSSSDTAIYYLGLVDVPNTDGKLRISMTTQVYIVQAEAKNPLIIPAAALGVKGDDGRYAVKVEKSAGQFAVRQVKIGINTNVQAEVLEGLEKGEQVVIGEKTAEVESTSSTSGNNGPPPGMM